MITAFTFSAISYSRICRAAEGFIGLQDFLIGIFTCFSYFLLLRIFDEFKDQEEDALYRTYLPVPRGLVTLTELKYLGFIIAAIQLSIILLFQVEMLGLYVIIMVYLLLMAKEFFVPQWLKKRQIAYITSHMMIIPLIDLYSSGLDWEIGGHNSHFGIAWFMLVSFINGLVLEIGRKIRTKESEEEGVVSYTKLYGTNKAIWIWLGLITATLISVMGAMVYAGYGLKPMMIIPCIYVLCIAPAISFKLKPTIKKSKLIEIASGIWTVLMYLSLGAIPMIKNLIA
jgi:4-hydroxybenzoate polyprenyltransferase